MRGQEREQAAKKSRAIHGERKKNFAWLKNMPHRPCFVEKLFVGGLIRRNVFISRASCKATFLRQGTALVVPQTRQS
jgi:hypothetical protein